MRIAICRLEDVSVYTRDGFGRRFGNGAPADLDEIVVTNADASPLTLADALGRLVSGFEVVDESVQPSPFVDGQVDGVTEDE